MERDSDVKKVLDSFSHSVRKGWEGSTGFVRKQTAPVNTIEIKQAEKMPESPKAFPALMKTGGKLKYWKETESHRLSKPHSNIEPELLKRAMYDESDYCGSFGWKTSNGKYAEGYLLKLDSFDEGLVNQLRLKQGERVFRYINRKTAIGGMKPFIKINLEKGLLYFLDSESSERGETIFETRGVKAEFINLIEGKFENGGQIDTDSKEVQFFTYNGEEIMYEPHFKEFFVNDMMFKTMTEAKAYVDRGSKTPEFVKDAYRKGLFAQGGKTPVKRFKIFLYYGGEQADEVLFAETIAEAHNIAAQAEHAEIIDTMTNNPVFAKGGMIDLFEDYTNIPPKIQSILDDYSEDFEEGNYEGLGKALKEVEANGYTFEYYLDGEAYGLRPLGVPLSDLKGYESEEFAKGGTTENLVKELRKLQRDLNSSRLSTYREGDNSPEEQARQAERASKLARFNEILKLLNASGAQFSNGGMVDLPPRNERKNKTYYSVIWDDGQKVNDLIFENKDEAEQLYDEMVEKNYQPVHLSKNTFNEYGHLEKHNTYRMHPKFEKGGNVQEWIYWKIESDGETLYEKTHSASPNIPKAKRISKEEYESNVYSDKYTEGGRTHTVNGRNVNNRIRIGYVFYYGNNSRDYMGFEVVDFSEDDVTFKVIEGAWGSKKIGDIFRESAGTVARNLRKGYYMTSVDDLDDESDDEEFEKGGKISEGDWVTLKSTGKRHKVARVITKGGKTMYDLYVSQKGGNTETLLVDEDQIESTKFFRTKFVKVPTNVTISYKIGDRVKFTTKKGEEKGQIKLYKYIPATNKIMYVIKTDSGWNANVYQDNVTLIGGSSSPSNTAKPAKKTRTTFTLPVGFEKGDKVGIKDASSLSGVVTKVISDNEIEVDVQDSLGITMKVGVVTTMTFSPSELVKL